MPRVLHSCEDKEQPKEVTGLDSKPKNLSIKFNFPLKKSQRSDPF